MDLEFHPDLLAVCQLIQYLVLKYPGLKDRIVIENGEISFNRVSRDIVLEVIEKFSQIRANGVVLSVNNSDGSVWKFR
jgi:hypothetical protein